MRRATVKRLLMILSDASPNDDSKITDSDTAGRSSTAAGRLDPAAEGKLRREGIVMCIFTGEDDGHALLPAASTAGTSSDTFL